MKKVVIITFLFALSLTLFLFVYNHHNKQEHFFSDYSLTKSEIDSLQDGDILLRHGYGMVSDIIVNTLNEKYDISHCAVLVKDSNQLNVIHTVSQSLSDFDGMQIQSLKRFVSDSKKNSIMVVRFKNKNNSLISEFAKYYLSRKVPFDNDFDIEDSSKLYCTEFIWRVLENSYSINIKEDILKNKNKLNRYKFDIFWDTAYFQIVINHQLRKTIK